MPEAVIVAAVRTPIGRYAGALKDVRPDDLAALAIKAAVARAGIDPASIEDVIFGCSNQAGEDNRNVARMAALLAGLPVDVPGQTVNRLCGSGLQAIITAAHAIQAGAGEVFVAGGVESMTRAPLVALKPEGAFPRGDQALVDSTIGWRFTNPRLAAAYPPYSMGETAEWVAVRWGVSREDQDAFALESQRRAGEAIAAGRFKDEIVPVSVPAGKGETRLVDTDEHPRETSLAKLAALKPAFVNASGQAKGGGPATPTGTVTAGNASGINDGAAALVVMSDARARALGLVPLARVAASAVAGVDPAVMGIGPVPATRKAVARAGITVADLDVAELNEAFAAQALACMRDLGLDPARVNPNGGAIALGHPLGASGARLTTTLLYELRRRDARWGLATMCVGVGQGIAAVFERPRG